MKRTDLIKLVSPLPSSIWGHILLRAGNGKIEALSVSNTLSMSVSMPYEGEAWEVAPHYKTLKTALAGLTGDDVSLDIGDTLQISSKRKRRIACIKVSLFPELPKIDADPVKVSGKQLREAIAFVRDCAYLNIDKPHLIGVHLNGNDVVATDGYSLRCANVDAVLPVVTVPSETATLLAKILPDTDVLVRASERLLAFQWNNGSLTTGLAPEGFPATYPNIIKAQSGGVIDVQANVVAKSVSAVSEFAGSITSPIYVNCGSDGITLSCSDAEEPVENVDWPYAPRKMLLNGGALADMLSAYGKEVVTVVVQDGETAPLLFHDRNGKKGALMLMRQ